jgi:sodium/potassium/calcium exchanger 6
MRKIFRQTQEQGVFNTIMTVISAPLNFLRDYTIPIAENDQWDRQRAATIPVFIVFAFFYLEGFITSDEKGETYLIWSLICIIPGALIGTIIKLKTKVSVPPKTFMNISAFLCFLMSIAWIGFTCNVILDLLKVFGFIFQLPPALLALTLVAWGNSLGDMSADCAMTQRGFGEMACTACVAGPVFNFLCGIGFAMTI